MMVFVVCALAPISALRHAPREKVNFDFGWRHRLAMDADGRQCPQATSGVNYGTGGRKFEKVASAGACCDYCSNTPSCKCWDWNSETNECYVKTVCTTKQEEKNRVSGMFPRPDGSPKQAAVNFDDSSWHLVDAPHDMLIVQQFNQTSSKNQAFIPRNAGWYRKHFYLPKEWSGASSYVWWRCEGSFHETTIYVNGHIIAVHKQGYTSFSVRLDNITNMNFGKDSA